MVNVEVVFTTHCLKVEYSEVWSVTMYFYFFVVLRHVLSDYIHNLLKCYVFGQIDLINFQVWSIYHDFHTDHR